MPGYPVDFFFLRIIVLWMPSVRIRWNLVSEFGTAEVGCKFSINGGQRSNVFRVLVLFGFGPLDFREYASF